MNLNCTCTIIIPIVSITNSITFIVVPSGKPKNVLRYYGKKECFTLQVMHNHPDELYIREIRNMKQEILRMCQETTICFKDIFDTVCRTNLSAAALISYNSMKNNLQS